MIFKRARTSSFWIAFLLFLRRVFKMNLILSVRDKLGR
jgi:hypothetical protein